MGISILTALELDEKSISNQFVLIEENNTSDGSFVVSSLLQKELQSNHKIIMLLCHNSIGHYHAIGQKLGYNLMQQQDQGNLTIFDLLSLMSDKINHRLQGELLKNVYLEIRQKIVELSNEKITLIMENLLRENQNLNIICHTHNFVNDQASKIFVNTLKHKAHLNVILDDFLTGRASDVSGKLYVKWRTKDLMMWSEPSEYHYHLMDKNVVVFAPGTNYLL